MKMNSVVLLMALVLTAPATNLLAQDEQPRPRRPRPEQRDGDVPPDGQRPRGPRPEGQGDGQKPPVPPLIAALDANRDGVIDEKEIANASEALKKLDTDGDGKLQMEELRPPRPEGDGPRPPREAGGRPGRPEGPPPGDAPRRPRPPQDGQ